VSLGSLLPCRLHRRRGAAVVTARCCASTPEQAMSKLTDTQLVTLSAASQREDRGRAAAQPQGRSRPKIRRQADRTRLYRRDPRPRRSADLAPRRRERCASPSAGSRRLQSRTTLATNRGARMSRPPSKVPRRQTPPTRSPGAPRLAPIRTLGRIPLPPRPAARPAPSRPRSSNYCSVPTAPRSRP
jgi:hypothetical protein